jgi:hypothetical protein
LGSTNNFVLYFYVGHVCVGASTALCCWIIFINYLPCILTFMMFVLLCSTFNPFKDQILNSLQFEFTFVLGIISPDLRWFSTYPFITSMQACRYVVILLYFNFFSFTFLRIMQLVSNFAHVIYV